MRWKLLLAALALVCLGCTQIYAKQPPRGDDDMEREIFALINETRVEAGLNALKWDDDIVEEARGHSRDMAKKKVPFSHDGFDERIDRIRKKNPGITGAAENIAYGQLDGPRAVKLWLNSKGHRKNIMGKFARTAVGIATAKDGTIYLTQIFIL